MSAVMRRQAPIPLPGLDIVRMRRRHLRKVLSIESRVFPRPWSMSLFLTEMSQKNTRSYIVARIDGEVPNLGKFAACRRVARAIYLGSAPTADAGADQLGRVVFRAAEIDPHGRLATLRPPPAFRLVISLSSHWRHLVRLASGEVFSGQRGCEGGQLHAGEHQRGDR